MELRALWSPRKYLFGNAVAVSKHSVLDIFAFLFLFHFHFRKRNNNNCYL